MPSFPLRLVDLEAAARVVYRHMGPTPQYHWPLLSKRIGAEVWVKHENHTPIGAFKLRGGLVYMDALKRAEPDCRGVITATRGNHGQSVALAAGLNGLKAVIVVPHGNNPEKNAAMEALGAELIVHGDDFQASYEFAIEESERRGLHPVRAFHPDLVCGVGTYALEFFRGEPGLDAVYVPVGQGSGICGMISARDALGLDSEIIGVVADRAAAYALSYKAGKLLETETADTLADGLACRKPDPSALEIILKGASRIETVSEEAILEAMGVYLGDTHNLAEGAAAAPLAALLAERQRMAGKKVGLVLSGGNADRELIEKVVGTSG